MPDDKDLAVNVTFTLPASIVEWLDMKTVTDDQNRSQVARKIFREAKAREDAAEKTKKRKG